MENKYQVKTAMKDAACFICYKSTRTNLVNTSGTDYFYLCLNHVKDPACCTPIPLKHLPSPDSKQPKTPVKEVDPEPKVKVAAQEAGKPEDQPSPSAATSTSDRPISTPLPSGTVPVSLPKEIQYYTLHSQILYLREKHHKDKAERARQQAILAQLSSLSK